MLNKLLQNYGFSSREAKIYLTCLEFGEDVVSSIARRAWENRVTTYSILKDLTQRGIANEVNKNKKKYYSVIAADTLIAREEKKYIKLKKALPEFLAVTNHFASKTKISYHEWFENVKEIFDETLKQDDEILVIRGNESIKSIFKKDKFSSFHTKRIQRKIPIKIIYSEDYKAYQDFDIISEEELKEKEYRENLVIQDDLFQMENDIVLYGKDRIIMTFFDKKYVSCILLKNKDMFKSLKGIFNMFWKMSHKLK